MNAFLKLVGLALFVGMMGCSSIPKAAYISKFQGNKLILASGKTYQIPHVYDGSVTTLILVRHAEKDTSNKADKDPHLTKVGQDRAEKLKDILTGLVELFRFQVFTTDKQRAIETAAPTVNYCTQLSKGTFRAQIYEYSKAQELVSYIQDYGKGKVLLVVGHTNNIPTILNHYTASNQYKTIPETDYSSMYIMNIDTVGKAKVFELKY
jgi:2,3-bisphosphoglycerate-dependent phosphoglycerate mutase